MPEMPNWIKAAEPAEWYLKGLSLAEAQRRTDAEMQMQREQMERAILEQRARLNVEQEYHRQVADLKRLELASEERRQQQAMAVQQARNQQMATYQDRMTAINLARALREKQNADLTAKKWATVSAEQQAMLEEAQENGGTPEAYLKAAMNHPGASLSPGYSSLLRSGESNPLVKEADQADYNILEDLEKKQGDEPTPERQERIDMMRQRIAARHRAAMYPSAATATAPSGLEVVRDANGKLVVGGLESSSSMITDRETGLPTLPQLSGGLVPNAPLTGVLPQIPTTLTGVSPLVGATNSPPVTNPTPSILPKIQLPQRSYDNMRKVHAIAGPKGAITGKPIISGLNTLLYLYNQQVAEFPKSWSDLEAGPPKKNFSWSDLFDAFTYAADH